MGQVQVRNVPPEVHEALRDRARGEGMSMSAYVLKLIMEDLELPTQREWLALVKHSEPVDVDSAAAVREARTEREAELLAKLGPRRRRRAKRSPRVSCADPRVPANHDCGFPAAAGLRRRPLPVGGSGRTD